MIQICYGQENSILQLSLNRIVNNVHSMFKVRYCFIVRVGYL